MWEQLMQIPDLMLYLLAAELLILCLLQLRTNGLLKRELKMRRLKTEKVKLLKEEVKNGESKIPVTKFDELRKKDDSVSKDQGKELKNTEDTKKDQPKECFDAKEMKVLQDMLAEYFG